MSLTQMLCRTGKRMCSNPHPLVSCIMPTADRRRFVPAAIRNFQAQDYPNRELIILDDGHDSIADLVPQDERIRYIRKTPKQALGSKRNECIRACRGDLIMHWDDDDWSAPHRITYQAEALLREKAELCGLRQMLFHDVKSGETWLYQYPKHQRLWLAGGSLLYTRDFWQRSPFPNLQVGEDTRFVWSQRDPRLVVLPDYQFYVAMIHTANTSPKLCTGPYWSRWPDDLRRIMGDNLPQYGPDTASFSVVILSSQAENLVPCVRAILQNEPNLAPSDIVVVDDGARAFAEALLPPIQWVPGVKPFVFARNANLGIGAAKKDTILLNDDARLITLCGFSLLASEMKRHPEVGVCSAGIRGAVVNPRQIASRTPHFRYEDSAIAFVCVFLPWRSYVMVGALDEQFVGYGFEDNDYCARTLASGQKIGVWDGCVVDHSGELPSTFRTRPDINQQFQENRRYYQNKWGKRMHSFPAVNAGSRPPDQVATEVLWAEQIAPEWLHDFAKDWLLDAGVASPEQDGGWTLHKTPDLSPGSERGLASKTVHSNVALSFDVRLQKGTLFLAKICLQDAGNQSSNSYHIYFEPGQCYFACHHHVLGRLNLREDQWTRLTFAIHQGRVGVHVDGNLRCVVQDNTLTHGHCFLGIKGGTAHLRNIHVAESTSADVGGQSRELPSYSVMYERPTWNAPTVSVITTVYNRVEALERCLHSVNKLRYPHWEQVIVADAPDGTTLNRLKRVVENYDRSASRRTFATLQDRSNNWGITPGAIGLHLIRGKYVCFLSDDNCYLPDHFDPLVSALESTPTIGFVYSSCLYAGFLMLRCSTPQPGGIDLGQPLFRRELFDRFLNGGLPFREYAWDWHMIHHFLKNGVQFKHIDKPTFVFRSEKYPKLRVASR